MDERAVVRGLGPHPQVPLSRALRDGEWLFVSGIVPMDEDGNMSGSVEEQTHLVLRRISALLEEAGGELRDVVSVRVYLSHPGHYAAMNAVYETYFTEPYPVRSCVVVGMVTPACSVVMEAVARLAR